MMLCMHISDTLLFYTNINRGLLKSIANYARIDEMDRELVALNNALLAGDIAGTQRGLGSSFFVPCHLTENNRRWYREMESSKETLLDQV